MNIPDHANASPVPSAMSEFIAGFSIEVTPRTAVKIPDFRDILPRATRVYVAQIEGTPADDMVATAKRLADEGFAVVPHITARTIRSRSQFQDMAERYRDTAGVNEALLLAGGIDKPYGQFHSSVQLLETGILEQAGYSRVFVAGHPEGNRDIDPEGGTAETDRAILHKQRIADDSGMAMELTTQFAFEAAPVIAWATRIRELGVTMPINVGVAGPTKLQTLLKYAVACGVGPSIRVIQRRARDVVKLLSPVEPDSVVADLVRFRGDRDDALIKGLHIFPLGGIRASAAWASSRQAKGRASP